MTSLRPAATLAAAVAMVGVLSACSQDAQTLDSAAASPLHQRVQSVRVALQSEDTRGARAALTEFRADVQRLADAGSINLDDAQVLVAYSQEIEAGIPAAVPGQTAESTAPKLVAPRHLDDVTAPVEPTAPVETATPVPLPTPVTAPTPQDDTVDDAPDIDLEPESPDPDNSDPADPEPEPENPGPENPASGDTGVAADGAGGD